MTLYIPLLEESWKCVQLLHVGHLTVLSLLFYFFCIWFVLSFGHLAAGVGRARWGHGGWHF